MAISAWMYLANSSGVLPTGFAPWPSSFSRTSGWANDFAICCRSLSTMGLGVPAGATMPNQELAS